MQRLVVPAYGSAVQFYLASGLASGNHQIRIDLEGLGYTDRWNAPIDMMKINELILDTGAQTVAPVLNPMRMVVYGDSITEGANTLGDENIVADKQWSTTWDADLAASLNAEVSAIAFQGQGYEVGGQGNVPAFLSSYQFIMNGVSRTFSSPNYVFINEGSNGTTTQSDVATMMVNLRAAYPKATIYQIVPFGGYANTVIPAAFAAQSDPNLFLLNLGTQGVNVVNANSTDGEHPTPTGDADLAALLLALIPH
jgi:hypothetical protein